MTRPITIVGEGRNELGDPLQPDGRPGPPLAAGAGVIEAILCLAAVGDWRVAARVEWKNIAPRLEGVATRRGHPGDAPKRPSGEERAVAALAERARRTTIVALRDTDGDGPRRKVLERAREDAARPRRATGRPAWVLGVVDPALECWIVDLLTPASDAAATASLGRMGPGRSSSTQTIGRTKAEWVEAIGRRLTDLGRSGGTALPTTSNYVDAIIKGGKVESARLGEKGCLDLQQFISDARKCLGAAVSSR